MNREDAYEGQHVRVVNDPSECDIAPRAGQEGSIIQIWDHPSYKWYDWATVQFPDEAVNHVLFEDLEPVKESNYE